MNICKIKFSAKSAIALALPLAICFSLGGCSLFGEPQLEVSSKAESLLSSIPQPMQTSYSYSAITNENVKNLYAQIESECQKPVPEEIQCTGKLSQKDIYEAIVAFKNDHPDIFWLKNTFTYYDYDGSTHIELAYITSGDALDEQKENFNTALSSFVDNATMYYSEYEREKYVNDFIVDNCEYDTEAAKSDYTTGNVSTAYGVLVEGKAICEGYARAFQLLCNKLGIECVSVTGMTDNVGHAWNCARIDGDWCQVDVTWNDSGNEVDRYYYFNLTDEQMYATHRPDDYFADIEPENYNNDENLIGNLYIPECTTTSHNYYMNTASMLYDFDDETYDNIVTNLALAALNGDKYFSLYVSDSLDFGETYSKLINDAYIINYIDSANDKLAGSAELSTSSYAYKNETLRVITIELSYVN